MSSEASGKLYLVPNTLGGELSGSIPPGNVDSIRQLGYWIAENPKTARDFLKRVGTSAPLQSIRIERLDKNTPPAAIPDLLAPVLSGADAGLLSEAGCPAIADPGALLVRLAHAKLVHVIPLVGPSSLMLALMGSGLEGQRFNFHGYLPVAEADLLAKIRQLEIDSGTLRSTQIFIETPYRNLRLFNRLLTTLAPETMLCVACDLTLASESIITKKIREWRKASMLVQDGRPAVFLFLSDAVRRVTAPSPSRGPRNSKGH